eukprot:10167961-Prorocentrum_lima.AAC.1
MGTICALGKVEAGTLYKGQKVKIMPMGGEGIHQNSSSSSSSSRIHISSSLSTLLHDLLAYFGYV